MANFISTADGKRFVTKGDKVTFKYDHPHKGEKEIRIGTVDAVKGNALIIMDDDRDGAFRGFSGAFMSHLVTL